MKIPASFRSFLRRVAQIGAILVAVSVPSRAATPLPSIYGFNVAAESTINVGTTTSLSWGVGNATTVTLSPGIGDVTNKTSIDITPTATTTYTLTATNSAGSVTKTKKITVVVPPVFLSLKAAPASITAGTSSTLSWSATGASYYLVTADNGDDPGTVFESSAVVQPRATTVYTVTAVNTAGRTPQTTTVTVTAPVPKPTISSFTASPTSVVAGGAAALNWSVSGATALSISPGIGAVTGTSLTINPAAATTYTLTATNASGSVTKKASVSIVAPPVISSFSATPASVPAGGATTLSWSASGAAVLSIAPDVGTVTGTSVSVTPSASTTYVLTAANAAGLVTKTTAVAVTAAVPLPKINSFSSQPGTIAAGGSATLAWSVDGATTVLIKASAGANPGTVTGASVSVTPAATTTYTLTATNSTGSVMGTTTVSVGAATPVIASFAASPKTISLGSPTTLNWSVNNATDLSITANVGPSPGAVTGTSTTVTPALNTVYTLKATNDLGSVTKTASVTVTGPAAPAIATFMANPAFVLAGAPSTLNWSVSGADSLTVTADVGASPGAVTGTSLAVSPTTTTTYRLTATNDFGATSATVPVTIYTPGNGNVVHPRIWVTPTSASTLTQRAAANDPAWIKLRNDCDAYLAMGISLPDKDPSSNTINGGYEFNDYLLPSEELALGYVAAKVADPVRAAKYAAKERQLLLALSDPVHHGRPTTDSGYSIRSYVPALALGYDWIYETLSDSDRAQIYTEINRWVTSFDQQGFGRDFPQGNYFAGYYCAKALGALATEGDNPGAAAMWNDWLNRLHYGMVQPYHAQWLSGGGAPDGWNYGPFETINMIRPIAAALTAKGLDLIHDAKPFAYFDGHARWMTQFTWPDLKTVSDRGFVYEGNDPTATDADWATQFNGLLHLANGDNAALMQRYTLDIRALRGAGGVDPWSEFLFQDNAAPTADYRVPVSYHTPGDGQVAMRSSWDANAVWASFQSGPLTNYPGSAEELFDQGSLAIQRGDVQFVVNPWGALMRNTPGTDDGNDVFNDVYNELFNTQTDGVYNGRRIFNTYYAVRADGYWGQDGNGPGSTTTLPRFEEGGAYVLMRGTHLESQYADDHPITGWTRNIAYLRPNLFVAYDRTSIRTATTDNWMAWHVGSAPVEQTGAAAGTHRFDVVDTRAGFGGNLFRGRVTTVLPAGHTVKSIDTFGRGKVYRLEVRPASPVSAATWLTVFDASPSAAAASSAAPLTAAAGNVIAGAVEGTIITGAGGSNTAVLFSQSGGVIAGGISFVVPAVNTYFLVTDLQPNTGYAVTAMAANGSLSVQFAPGGTLTTTAQGTLSVTLTAQGAIPTP